MMRRYIFSLLILLQSLFAYSEYTGPKTFGVELYNGYAEVTYYGELKNIPLWNDKEPLYVEVFDDDGEMVSHAWISESNRSFRIDGYGLYSFKVLQKIQVVNTESDSEKYSSLLKWEQDVYIPQEVSFEAELLAEQYKPILVFNKEEEYFPISVDEILDYRGVDDTGKISIGTTFFSDGYEATPGEDLKGFMQYNGHKDFWFDFGSFESTSTLGSLYLRDLKKSKTGDMTVYWDAVEENNKLYLMYYFIYAFDPKLGSSNDPAFAAHAFDRESFLITFDKTEYGYHPSYATYPGHLESQKISFYGCKDDPMNLSSCEKPGDELDALNWKGGRTSIDWEYINKIDNSPILYIAKGAHAVYPTYGYYHLPGLTEEAGSTENANVVLENQYVLNKIDFKNRKYMSYSGAWVDVRVFDNATFPPFVRTPYGKWFDGTNFNLNSCFTYEATINEDLCKTLRDDYFTYLRGFGSLNLLNIDLGVYDSFVFKFVSQSGDEIPTSMREHWSSNYTILYDAELTYPSRPFLVFARLKGNENWVDCGAVIKSSMKNYMYVSEEVELSCDAYDRDDDGYTDSEEVAASSDPINADSTPDDLDGDGFSNSVEENAGSDPNSAASTPDD